MKKLSLLLFICSAATYGLNAELKRAEKLVNPEHSDAKSISWHRNGIEIMTQTEVNENGLSMCIISPFDIPKGRSALFIRFKDGKLSGTSNGPALVGYNFAIDDFTKDGVPDFIQIIEKKTKKVVEAYSITHGIVTPIPDRLFMSNREEFYYNEEIVAYLKRLAEAVKRTAGR